MSDAENLPVNPDEIFIINEKEYRSFYEDAYKKILQPKYLVQTAIVLPFQIPLDEGASFSVVGKRNICTFHFTTIKLNLPANHGVIDKNSPKTTYYKSRVEMIFVSPKLLDINKRHSISDCIDILLDGLNDFLMAYLIMTKDADVYRISREMFSTLIIVRLLQTDNWHRQDAIFIMHLNEPWERPIMHREDQHNLMHFMPILHENWGPIVLSEELAINSMRYLREGKYREAVIYSQTSIETLLDGLYLYLLIDEGNTYQQANAIIEKAAFMTTVRNQYQNRVGGNWNVNNPRTVAGGWKSKTYSLRNKVVHEGYYPNYQETSTAIAKANAFRFHVARLIKRKKRKYPITYSKFFM